LYTYITEILKFLLFHWYVGTCNLFLKYRQIYMNKNFNKYPSSSFASSYLLLSIAEYVLNGKIAYAIIAFKGRKLFAD